MGWFRPVHCTSVSAQEARALLAARKQPRKKMLAIEPGRRGVLSGLGLRIGRISKGRFAARVQDLAGGNMMPERVTAALLTRTRSVSRLRARGLRGAQRRGRNRAIVAVARTLATVLHRLRLDGTTVRTGWEEVRTAWAYRREVEPARGCRLSEAPSSGRDRR